MVDIFQKRKSAWNQSLGCFYFNFLFSRIMSLRSYELHVPVVYTESYTIVVN